MRVFQKKICAVVAAVMIIATVMPSAMAVLDLTASADNSEAETINGAAEGVQTESGEEQEASDVIEDFSNAQERVETTLAEIENADSPAEVEIIIDGRDADTEYLSFIKNGVTYAPVRGVCEALGATEVTYDAKSDKVFVYAKGLEMVIPMNDVYLTANGRCLYVGDGFVKKGGRMMAPLRTMCQAFGVEIKWDEEDAAAIITSGGTPILSGDKFYNDDDLYWMTKIINAEAGAEPFLGKIAVGNVIMNRVAYSEFPNNVHDVIFDRRCGIQFTPTVDGSIYKKSINAGCEEAAKLALEGTDVIGDALYFAVASLSCWAKRNRPFAEQIGGHAFYL